MRRSVLALPVYMTPGGFTAGQGTLVDAVLRAAGMTNVETRPGYQGAGPVLTVLERLPVKPQTCPPGDEQCIVLNARPKPAHVS